jgi:type IV secretion system protein VirB1
MLSAATLTALLATCAPGVAPSTAQALIATESAGNPFAIGVVGSALVHQPSSLPQALATVQALDAGGWDYSVGLAQINRRNFARMGLTRTNAFVPCANLQAMQHILGACYARASRVGRPSGGVTSDQAALRDALSCYYSGNFVTGYRHGYVGKVVAAAQPVAVSVAASVSANRSAGSSRVPRP